jgi:pimeloyl-ACP methyl ester carboxylesterase
MKMLADNTIAEPTVYWQPEQQLSYLQAGKAGPPVLLLHGLGAFKELWWSTLHALAPHYRAYAPDMPGHGGSPLGKRGRMPDLACLMAEFCATLGLAELTLVGHSMGGNVALELALLRPKLVRRLVLVDAVAETQQLLPLQVGTTVDVAHTWSALRLSQLFRRALTPIGRNVPHRHGGGLVRPFLRRSFYALKHNPADQWELLAGLFDNPIGNRIIEIAVPTLVITGQYDSLVPPAHAKRLAAAIPGACYAVVHGAMHNPMDERPAAFERILLDFLQQ